MANPFRVTENEFNQLTNLTPKPQLIPAKDLQGKLGAEEIMMLKRIGLTTQTLERSIQDSVQVNYDRMSLYGQLARCSEHWLAAAALELYADYATPWSQDHEATVWVTGDSDMYVKELTDMLDRIGIEEKIYDWAHTLAMYGDHFLKPEIVPGMGIISVTDDEHPLDVSRAEYKGQLIGFYRTPLAVGGSDQTRQVQRQDTGKLLPPWEYVHLRLLGAKKYRGSFGSPRRGDIRALHTVTGASSYQLTTRYGTSLLTNALPSYKRLRLAEDSLLMARVTRGIIRYIWKLKVSSCLRGNTKIELMDGTTPTIREMAKNEDQYIGKTIWTVNETTHELEPKKILAAKKTRRKAQMVRVHLDNEEHVDSTPDHRFMMRDGSYKEAQCLTEGDSLMPFYKKSSPKYLVGYNLVYNPAKDNWCYEHRKAVGKLDRGKIVHHKDFNKNNNDLDNLQIMERGEHSRFHHEHSKKYGYSYSMRGKKQTKEHIQKVIESRRKNNPQWHSEETRAKIGEAHSLPREIVKCVGVGCDNMIERIVGGPRRFCCRACSFTVDRKRKIYAFRTKFCGCGCGEQFKVKLHPITNQSEKRFVPGHNSRGETNPMYGKYGEDHPAYGLKKGPAWNSGLTKETSPKVAAMTKKSQATRQQMVLNHKVMRVEWLDAKEDTYDLTIEGTPNFPLASGVFVHNSNAEMVAELIDQYATMITRARSVDTDDDSPFYGSRQNPFSVMEDLFVPVWGETGDLTFDKVGGEADIRWIKDIDELRNQMAVALRTPLSLLGGFVKEATGSLGSEAIEKLDLRFARNARRVQRALIEGIYRICQIHLAAMNLDPDPVLFGVHMDSTSSIETSVMRENLDDGVDTIGKFIDTAKEVQPNLDEPKLFDYLADKLLRISGFSLKDFEKAVGQVTGERIEEIRRKILNEIRSERASIVSRNIDLVSYLPMSEKSMWQNLTSRGINEVLGVDKRREEYRLTGLDQAIWEERYGDVTINVMEDKEGDDTVAYVVLEGLEKEEEKEENSE